MVLLDRDQRARMESGGRRTKSGFALLAIGLLSVATARGEEAPKPAAAEIVVDLLGESEQVIGRQTESITMGAEGQKVRRTLRTAYTVSGHGPSELEDMLHITLDRGGSPQRWQ